jgi:type III pantothenate kinase
MKKSLVIDIGNTLIKVAVFYNEEMVAKHFFKKDETDPLNEWIKTYEPQIAIVSSVAEEQIDLVKNIQLLQMSAKLQMPFQNSYATPNTLGMDRAAAVAGAMHLFPNEHVLVIDAGTCITYDFVTNNGEYFGGGISPGLHMRLKALNVFTQRLPLVDFTKPETFIGNSTERSMLVGVYYGMLDEINGMVERYTAKFGTIKTISCGGDALLFDKQTKTSIFATPDLVLIGLNKILHYNV